MVYGGQLSLEILRLVKCKCFLYFQPFVPNLSSKKVPQHLTYKIQHCCLLEIGHENDENFVLKVLKMDQKQVN